MFQYKKRWDEVESQLFKKMATDPIKGEGKYGHGKLKTWKERIKTNFMVTMFDMTFIAVQRQC